MTGTIRKSLNNRYKLNIDKEIFTKSFKKAVKLGKSGGPDNIFGKRLKTG